MPTSQSRGPSKRQKGSEKKKSSRVKRITLNLIGLFLLLLIGAVILTGCSAALSAPDVTQLQWNSATILFDRNGNEIFRLHAGENRSPIKLKDVPAHVQQSFIAVEDPNFYQHHGIDPRGFARAVFRSTLYVLHLPGGRLQGGSTITQQLARDAWLSQEQSMKRKLQEAWVALQVERKYTKDEILEMYLNQIYFGHGAYGIEAASRTFFAKEVGELTVPEAAQLAGMINGPSIFDPYVDPQASLDRRDVVLSAMLREQFIDQPQYDAAKAYHPKIGAKKSAETAEAGHFTDLVITLLQNPEIAAKYGIKLGDVGSVAKAGLKVYTTMDPTLQKQAEAAVAQQMAAADREYGLAGKSPRPEAALVTISPKTGEVLAMVGGRDHAALLEFNRATDALRQPGSSIKPLVSYIPAIEAGLSPATILDDSPVMLSSDGKTVWPQNFDFKYSGLQPMRYGVEQSINPMSVRAMIAAGGPQKSADYARRFGLSTVTKDDETLALALGGLTKGTSVLDMTSAFGTIANMGTRAAPVVITKIEDRANNVIFAATPNKQQVVKPATAYLMIDMMKDVIRRGTAYGFTGGFKGWPAAGKTGTTEFNRDAWFIGFTPDLVTAVWNGYDNPSNHLPWTGAFVPVKIWNQYMSQAVTQRPTDWARPNDVVSVNVCRRTGALPSDTCPPGQVVSDLFVRGTEPKNAGDLLVKARVVPVTVTNPTTRATSTQWQQWQLGCMAWPQEKVFVKRPQPRVVHPTDPYNPKYIPADAKDELPTAMCQPAPLWQKWFGGQPAEGTQGAPGQPGTTPPSSEPTPPGMIPGPPGTTPVPPGTAPVPPGVTPILPGATPAP